MNDEANDDALQALAEQWLAKAADDLEMADLLLAAPTAAKWGACFHAQQAAEKALKAILVIQDKDVPYTHSLTLLRQTLGDVGKQFDEKVLEELEPWAVAGRYPEEIPEPSPAEAKRLVDTGRSVVDRSRQVVATTAQPES